MAYAQIARSVYVRRVRVSLGRRRAVIVAPLLLGVAGVLSCQQPPERPATPAQTTLRFGVALPKTPEATIGFRAFVNNLFSESLVGTLWDGKPFKRLASDWTWKDNGLTLELRIRDHLEFHDGTRVDNEFIRKSLIEAFRSPNAVSYQSVTSVEAIENNSVAIRLSRPEALLISDLSNSTISIGDRAKPNIGLGPYRVLERGPTTRLASFAAYYRGKPKIDSIEIQEFEEQRTSWAALMRGQIDAVHEIVPGALEFLQAQGQTDVRTFPFTRPYFIFLLFNVKHPVLKDPEVRRALSYAVDRQAIIDAGLNRQGRVADGPVWPFHWAYSTAQRNYTHNVEAATLRLDAAGLRVPKERQPGQMPSRFRFKCLTVAKHATFEKIALILQKQLYEIGVDMEIEAVSLADLQARAQSGNYDAILAERTSGRSLVWTYLIFHSAKGGGAYKAADARLDSLRSTSSDAEVKSAVSDLQRVFHDDPPAIFIAWPKVARVVSSKFVIADDDETKVPEEPGRDIINSIWDWRAVGQQ